MFVEQGQPKVERNQFVQKGELLVSGQIGKDKNIRTVSAKGKVFGEVWYYVQVTLPQKTTFGTYTGERMDKHYLSLFGWRVPVWGFGDVTYKDYEVDEDENTFRMFKWEVPISYVKREIYESESVIREYTAKEAVKIAKQMGDEEIEQQMEEDSKIISGKILHHRIDNGKVSVSMYYKVIENIAKEQPIIGGD